MLGDHVEMLCWMTRETWTQTVFDRSKEGDGVASLSPIGGGPAGGWVVEWGELTSEEGSDWSRVGN